MTDTTNDSSVPVSVLVDKLRAHDMNAKERAAVELLIWHESWINRLAYGIGTEGRFLTVTDTDAKIDWKAMDGYTRSGPHFSSTECRVWSVAASLAAGLPVDLQDVLSPSLGMSHTRAVLTAMASATLFESFTFARRDTGEGV